MSIEQIWLEYKNSLRAFLTTKISNPADVEELLQDTLLKTHLNIHHLQDQRSLKAWLFQIAHHVIVDFYRRQNKHVEIELDNIISQQENKTVKAELIKCIEPFLQAMPEEEADLIRKIDLEGYSQKEEALKLNISYSTYKSRLQKSRSKLKALFDCCCDFEIDKYGNLVDYHPKQKKFC